MSSLIYTGIIAFAALGGPIFAVMSLFAIVAFSFAEIDISAVAVEVYRISTDTWWFVAKIVISSIIMAVAVLSYSLNVPWIESDFWQRVAYLSLTIAIGIFSYAIAILILGVRPHQLIDREVTK